MHHHACHWCVLTLWTAVPSAFPECTCWQPVDIDINVDWDLRFSQWCWLGHETCHRADSADLSEDSTWYMLHLQGQTAKSREYLLGLPDLMKARWCSEISANCWLNNSASHLRRVESANVHIFLMCNCFYQRGHYAWNKLLWNRWTVPVHITSHNFVIFMNPAVRTSCLRGHSNQCEKFYCTFLTKTLWIFQSNWFHCFYSEVWALAWGRNNVPT